MTDHTENYYLNGTCEKCGADSLYTAPSSCVATFSTNEKWVSGPQLPEFIKTLRAILRVPENETIIGAASNLMKKLESLEPRKDEQFLFDHADIEAAGEEVASELYDLLNENHPITDKEVIFLCVLKGAVPWCNILTQAFSDFQHEQNKVSKLNQLFKIRIEYVQVSSYLDDKKVSRPVITFESDPKNMADQIIVVVDDIFDTGDTLTYLYEHLRTAYRASCYSAVMLSKAGPKVPMTVRPTLAGWENLDPKIYFYGFGMDKSGYKRELSCIYGDNVRIDEFGGPDVETIETYTSDNKK